MSSPVQDIRFDLRIPRQITDKIHSSKHDIGYENGKKSLLRRAGKDRDTSMKNPQILHYDFQSHGISIIQISEIANNRSTDNTTILRPLSTLNSPGIHPVPKNLLYPLSDWKGACTPAKQKCPLMQATLNVNHKK